ncbi:MAG: TIM barrel protein [Chloroflexota bacterium]|nr:MAG: xylose isomerase [Chloroflexota bacterium]
MPIRLANAPVSWGIYEFEGVEQKYPFTRVLDEIAETGYDGLELGPWGYLPTDPDVLRPELEKRNLKLLSSFVPVNFADANAIEAAEAHALKVGRLLAALGAVAIVLADDNGSVPELVQRAGQRTGSYLSPEQWDVYAAGVNRVARKIYDELGLKVVFHHHCAGYVETPEETQHLLERTDYDLVGLCLDTGHWEYAGGNALEAVKQYGERVRYLHLKDCDPNIRAKAIEQKLDYFQATAAGVFCELGNGSVDFPGIIAEMERLGYDGWAIVEQDVLTDDLDAPRESARRNREYLRSLGL